MATTGSPPIQRRLTLAMMKTTGSVLLLAMAAVSANRVLDYRRQKLAEISTLAATLGLSSTASLSFNDPRAAQETLGTLQAQPTVASAAIYSRTGELFALYRRPGRSAAPAAAAVLPARLGHQALSAEVHIWRLGQVELAQPIRLNGERLGVILIQSDLTDLLGSLRSDALVFGFVLLGAAGIGYVLALHFGRAVSGPILHLTQTIGRFSQTQDYTIRGVPQGHDELGRLIEVFNDMLERLQAGERQLKLQNDTLEEKVVERTGQLSRANQELEGAVAALRAARDVAEAASRSKSQFLANMSHEIRTPMNGVLGMTELLLKSPLTTAQRQMAQAALRSGESLLGIINDILDFSRIEAGRLELDLADFDLRETVEGVAESLAARAFAKGLELACRLEGAPPPALRGDAGRLRQVLTNLIGNAVKFTERGEVLVRVRVLVEDPRSLLVGFQVSDTGIGIPREAAERIFEAFAQADGSTTRRFGGTGLGLAISRQLVRLMGGQIEFDSAPGHGATFRFTARFARQAARPAAAAPPSFGGLRVLVVDDHAESRAVLRSQCASLGARADTAASGPLALALLRSAVQAGQPYDVALVDRQMPELSGPETLRAARADATLAATRLVLVSPPGLGGDWADEEVQDLTVALSKPVRQAALAECLSAVRAPSERPGLPEHLAERASRFEARVLLAEDSPVNQAVAEGMLARLGCQVDLATDGRAALAAATRVRYDLILMDCMMPELDGFQATAEIRRWESAHASWGRTAVVALTANAMVGDRERCLAAGMDDYLSKPFREDGLRAVLARWLCAAPAVNEEEGMPADVGRRPQAGDGAAHEPGASAAPAVDSSVIEALRALQAPGAPDIRERVITLYLQQTPAQLQELKTGLERDDSSAMLRAAHTMKSSSANVGAGWLAELCRDLESRLRNPGGCAAAPGVAAIEAEYARVQRDLEACLEGVSR